IDDDTRGVDVTNNMRPSADVDFFLGLNGAPHRPADLYLARTYFRRYSPVGLDREPIVANFDRAFDLTLDGEVFANDDLAFNHDVLADRGICDRRLKVCGRRSGHETSSGLPMIGLFR